MGLTHPRMIGFGISNRQTFEFAQSHAAGAIIGSRFVALLDHYGSATEALDHLREELKNKDNIAWSSISLAIFS